MRLSADLLGPLWCSDITKYAAAPLSFAAALANDQRLALQPDARSPFTSAEDVIRRLLPYHVFQIPEEDLHYTIEQHKQENLSRPLKRKRRRIEEAPQSAAPSKEEKPLAEGSSSASKQEQASSSSLASTAPAASVAAPDTTKKPSRAIRIRINPPKSEDKGKKAEPEPEPALPWWEADVEDDNFPSTSKTIELLDRYATLNNRLHKLLIRADGGNTSAQASVFMETQMDRLGLDYERECLAEDSRALTQARTRWEAVVRSNKQSAKLGGPGPSGFGSPAGAAFSSSAASRKSYPQTPTPRPNPNAEIPKFPIPLQIPLSVFPQLNALGISPTPASYLVPILGPNALSSLQASPLSQLSNIGPAPRPAPPDQNEAALLTGVTQGPTGQLLHVSVRLDKLQPAQLSGLAAVMSSLQAASNAAAAAAAAGKSGMSPSPAPPMQTNGTASSSQAPGLNNRL